MIVAPQPSIWRAIEKFRYSGVTYRPIIVLAVLLAALASKAFPARLLPLLAGIGVGLVLLRRPRWGIYLLPAVSLLAPVRIGTGTDVVLYAAVVYVPFLVLIWLGQQFARRKLTFPDSELNPPLFAFVVATVIAFLLGNAFWRFGIPQPRNLLFVQLGQLGIYYLSFAAFWLTPAMLSTVRQLRIFSFAFLAAVAFGLLAILVLPHFQINVTFAGAVPHQMVGAWFVTLCLTLGFFDHGLGSRARGMLLLAGIGGLIAVRFILQDWLGGWVPTWIAATVAAWLGLPRWRPLLLCVGIAGLFFLIPTLDLDAEFSISGGGRMTIWRSVTELGMERPIFGLGTVAYRYYHFVKPLLFGGAVWLNPNVSAHNMFVDLFAQSGLVAVVIYVWFYAQALYMAFRLFRRHSGFGKAYALATLGALVGILAADILAETSLPYVYNNGFSGFRSSVVSWALLGGLVVLEKCADYRSPNGNRMLP